MRLTAKVVPWSGVVGNGVLLMNERGRVVCQIAFINCCLSREQQETPAQELVDRCDQMLLQVSSKAGETR